MSIYCTTYSLGMEHATRCARMRKISRGCYSQDDSKPCTCESCPIIYQHSGILPAKKDARGGTFDLGAIPRHITRNGRDDGPEDGDWWPWLRVSVNDATVILTRKQVEKLHEALGRWLANTEAK